MKQRRIACPNCGLRSERLAKLQQQLEPGSEFYNVAVWVFAPLLLVPWWHIRKLEVCKNCGLRWKA